MSQRRAVSSPLVESKLPVNWVQWREFKLVSSDHDGVAAHQSEGGDHLFDSNLQCGPVHARAQFLLLACG